MSTTDPAPIPADATAVVFDVTDATFQAAVVERSRHTPVVVDLWAPWCGPCRQLGPLLEEAVAATGGEVVLAKVNVDENPQTSAAFAVQSIPAVHGLSGGRVVDGFVGARGREEVEAFVERLKPTDEQSHINRLLDSGDEESLREVIELDPPNEAAILGLAELLVGKDEPDEALGLLDRIPESNDSRRIAALARAGGEDLDQVESRLDALLDRVKSDPDARQEFLDVLELLGPDDPRTAGYRKALTTRLY